MYARGSYGGQPWASGPVVNTTPVTQTLPPPVPGGTTSYVTSPPLGALPWALGGWAGAAVPIPGLPGGVVAVPDPASGVIRVSAWWPDAASLRLARRYPDGTTAPVRRGYPYTVPAGSTRRNYATNPSAKYGLNGYIPADGNPALSAIADAPSPPGTGVRATISAAGSCGLTVPTALTAASGGVITVGVDLRLSAWPSGVTVTVSWTDANGLALTASTIALSTDQVSGSVAGWGRQIVTASAPTGVGPITASVKLTAAGLPAGATVDTARWTHESGLTTGSAVDGDTLGGLWTGTPGLSASVIAAVQTITDGEAPLDVPLTYVVHNPVLSGGSATSSLTTLDSTGRSWLTHPSHSGRPVRCRVTAAPALTRAATQATFAVIGRPRPVVVSSSRAAPTGTLTLDTPTFAERDALLTLLADGAPMLLRAPGDYGLGTGWWCAIGDVTEDPDGRPQWSPGRQLSLPFTVVDAPLGPDTMAA